MAVSIRNVFFVAIMLAAPFLAVAIMYVLGCDISRSMRDPAIIAGCALIGSAAAYGLTRRWPAALLYFVVGSAFTLLVSIPGLFMFGGCK